jgi:hypothetical protein
VPTLSSPSRQHASQLERVIVRTSRQLGVDLAKIAAAIGVGERDEEED